VEKALQRSIPFRAVVADSFYGEDEGFKQSLSEQGVGYVMALKPSHTWWHRVGEIGSPWEAAVAACPWLERPPGKERPGHPPPLAVGVRSVLVLLVIIWALASIARKANRGRERSRRISGGKGEKGGYRDAGRRLWGR
jgi:hypothetical protein